jgi:hypothetical protein
LGEALGYPDPDFDIWAYAIRNLGAVEIAVGGDHTTVTMRTATAHAEAIRVAEQFLPTLGTLPIRLRYEIGTWVEETYEDPQQAIGRMASALADAALQPRRVAFVSKARRLAALSESRLNKIETADERFSLLFKKWRMSQGLFDPEMPNFLVRFGLIDRTVVVGESPVDGELVFEHAGFGFKAYDSYDKTWTFRLQGKRFSDQPDPDYGHWVDRTYRSVLEQVQPRFEYVDAVIQARAAEPYRSRYDRLILPWRNDTGARLLTGISYQTAHPEQIAA